MGIPISQIQEGELIQYGNAESVKKNWDKMMSNHKEITDHLSSDRFRDIIALLLYSVYVILSFLSLNDASFYKPPPDLPSGSSEEERQRSKDQAELDVLARIEQIISDWIDESKLPRDCYDAISVHSVFPDSLSTPC
jgi:hypothetical protein